MPPGPRRAGRRREWSRSPGRAVQAGEAVAGLRPCRPRGAPQAQHRRALAKARTGRQSPGLGEAAAPPVNSPAATAQAIAAPQDGNGRPASPRRWRPAPAAAPVLLSSRSRFARVASPIPQLLQATGCAHGERRLRNLPRGAGHGPLAAVWPRAARVLPAGDVAGWVVQQAGTGSPQSGSAARTAAGVPARCRPGPPSPLALGADDPLSSWRCPCCRGAVAVDRVRPGSELPLEARCGGRVGCW